MKDILATESKRRQPVALFLVPSAVVVAAVLIGLRLHFQPPEVPAYALAPREPGAWTLHGGDRFVLELDPSRPVRGAVAVRGFLVQGKEVRPWDAPFAVTVDGAIRIDGPVETLFAGVPDGEWEVDLAVGRPEVLPTAPADVLRAPAEGDNVPAAWHLLRQTIRLRM